MDRKPAQTPSQQAAFAAKADGEKEVQGAFCTLRDTDKDRSDNRREKAKL